MSRDRPVRVTAAPIPDNEHQRLAALRGYMLLDSLPEPEFDRITALAAKLFDVPIALVTLIDADRQWFKSCVGLEAGETSRDDAFCAHALFDTAPLVVEDAQKDVRFAYNPYVLGEPHVRFYAGAPLLTREGYALGTLCVIDREPRTPTREQLETLTSLAAVVVDLVEARLGFRSREMFEKVAHLSPNVMYLFDLVEKKNVWANRQFIELLGYVPSSVGAELVERVFHPDDAKHAGLHFARMEKLRDDEVARLVFRARAADGTYRWFSARETIFERDPDGTPTKSLGIANDITDLRAAQGVAKEKTRLLEAVLASAGEGILAADVNGSITLINDTAREILGGVTAESIRDAAMRAQRLGIFETDGTTPIAHLDLPLQRAIRGESVLREIIVRSEDLPQGRYVLSTGRPLRSETGGIAGGVVTFRDITTLKQAQLALAELSVTDDLTGLPNKRALRQRLEQLAREGARGRKFAVVVTDVDHFKKVNDTYGHKTGDEVLVAVAKTLKSSIRITDFVGRYGGEEFVVLYTDVDESIAMTLAEKLRAAVAAIEQPVRITASFGVCANVPRSGDAESLMKAADDALYRAKREGRNRVVAGTT
jgi:diguanylate cyclase (GGDEF)-like protein/PAS domain S-box-containing protein